MPRVSPFHVFGRPALPFYCGVLVAAGALGAQEPMPGEIPGGVTRLAAADRAVLDSKESSKSCRAR